VHKLHKVAAISRGIFNQTATCRRSLVQQYSDGMSIASLNC